MKSIILIFGDIDIPIKNNFKNFYFKDFNPITYSSGEITITFTPYSEEEELLSFQKEMDLLVQDSEKREKLVFLNPLMEFNKMNLIKESFKNDSISEIHLLIPSKKIANTVLLKSMQSNFYYLVKRNEMLIDFWAKENDDIVNKYVYNKLKFSNEVVDLLSRLDNRL